KVLRCAIEEVKKRNLTEPFINVAGICGETDQAREEANLTHNLGYDLGLLSFGGLNDYTEKELIEHTKQIAEIIPIFGFYLQSGVVVIYLSYDFWRAFSEIPNVHALKISPFYRYITLDVVSAVYHSSLNDDMALYT